MKIAPPTDTFARVLELTGRAVKQNATIPVLTSVLIEADKKTSQLVVSATDMEISVQVSAGNCPVEKGGKAAVRAGLLTKIVKSISDEATEISTTESEATLQTEKGSYSINAYKAGDFPVLPQFPTDKAAYFTVPAGALAEAIEKVLPFTSHEDTRPVLTGVLATFEDGELTMAATDSYRLGVAKTKLDGAPAKKVSQIIPARGLKEVSRLASMADEIQVSITENQAMFFANGITVSSRLIDGNFPEYERLLPPAFKRVFRVNREQLLASLKRVNLFCGNTNPPTPIRLSFNSGAESLMGDELVIAGSSSEVGAGQEILSFTIESDGSKTDGSEQETKAADGEKVFVVAFNPGYLMSAVTTAGTEDVLFKFNDPLEPAMVFPADTEKGETTVELLLMPMRDQQAEDQKSRAKNAKGKEAGGKDAKDAKGKVANDAGAEGQKTDENGPEASEPEEVEEPSSQDGTPDPVPA